MVLEQSRLAGYNGLFDKSCRSPYKVAISAEIPQCPSMSTPAVVFLAPITPSSIPPPTAQSVLLPPSSVRLFLGCTSSSRPSTLIAADRAPIPCQSSRIFSQRCRPPPPPPPVLDDDLDDIRDADEAAQRAAVTNTTSYACAPPPMTATDVTRALRETTAAFVLGLSSSMVEEHTGGHARGRLVHVIRALDTKLA